MKKAMTIKKGLLAGAAFVLILFPMFFGCEIDPPPPPSDLTGDPTVTWPTGLSAHHGSNLTLADISLDSYTNEGGTPGTFSWTTPGNSVGDHGTQSHSITFTPADTAKYNTVTGDVDVLVSIVEMVLVKAGTFTIGPSGTMQIERQVTLTKDFYIGKYEVTQKEYKTVMGSLPARFTDPYGVGDDYPIYYVSWFDAIVFCNRLSIMEGLTPAYSVWDETDPDDWGEIPNNGASDPNYTLWNNVEIVAGSNGYRLPTEAQWEYAAKGGHKASKPYYKYSGSDTLADVIKEGNTLSDGTWQVGTYAANQLGIYDMTGNMQEWCWDWYADYPAMGTDPIGPSLGYVNYNHVRVKRGGNWWDSPLYPVTTRVSRQPQSWDRNDGFRVIRPAQ